MTRLHSRKTLRAALLGALCLSTGGLAAPPPPAAPQPVGSFEHLPVGIAVSKQGRLFLAFSRAIDDTEPYSLAEVKDGKPQLFPPGFKQDAGEPAADRLLAVQALTVDARDRLWILDSGKVGTNTIPPGSARLIAYDLGTKKVVKRIAFPAEVNGATSFLNDVRVDLSRGKEGVAYLTDASAEGPNALVVVDLATGKSVRRLNAHPSTQPADLVLDIHGQKLVQKKGPAMGEPLKLGADGLALSADGKWVYYCPVTSHHLYRVSADALVDPSRSDADVAGTVEDLGDKGFASDGLLEDAQGRILVTDLEHDAIQRRTPDGKLEVVVQAPEVHWPDSLALGPDGTLFFTVTQIDRSPRIQGQDKRQKPFVVYQVKTDSTPSLRASDTAPGKTPSP